MLTNLFKILRDTSMSPGLRLERCLRSDDMTWRVKQAYTMSAVKFARVGEYSSNKTLLCTEMVKIIEEELLCAQK